MSIPDRINTVLTPPLKFWPVEAQVAYLAHLLRAGKNTAAEIAAHGDHAAIQREVRRDLRILRQSDAGDGLRLPDVRNTGQPTATTRAAERRRSVTSRRSFVRGVATASAKQREGAPAGAGVAASRRDARFSLMR